MAPVIASLLVLGAIQRRPIWAIVMYCVVEKIVVPIVMDVTALSIVMGRRVVYIVVVAAGNGKVIVPIIMGRLQRVDLVGLLPDGQLVADPI